MKYVRLYGFDHKRTQTQFEVAWGELQQAIPKRKSSLVLGVSEDRLLLDGVPIETGPPSAVSPNFGARPD